MAEALLVIDTATDRTVVALRARQGSPPEDGSTTGPDRGAAALGGRLSALLASAGVALIDVAGIGAGTGPGSFTGLRVGLATAKTLAWSLGVPLVGIRTIDALRRAAATPTTPAGAIAVVQGAGARDHYLALPGEAPVLVAPGTDLAAAIAGHPVIALGTDVARIGGALGPDGTDPLAAGASARDGLGVALLELLAERLAADRADDPATLVPVYVALPRGIATGVGAGWRPEIR